MSGRTTNFVMSAVQAPTETPVLFVEIESDGIMPDGYISLARLDDIERLKRAVRESALDEVQEYVGAHELDTSAGRRIHAFITRLLKEN